MSIFDDLGREVGKQINKRKKEEERYYQRYQYMDDRRLLAEYSRYYLQLDKMFSARGTAILKVLKDRGYTGEQVKEIMLSNNF